jgi:hypothetical protein
MIKMKLTIARGSGRAIAGASEQYGANTSIQAEQYQYSRVCKRSRKKVLKWLNFNDFSSLVASQSVGSTRS